MALVLALEPDPKQAAVLKQIVRDRVGAQFVLADSKDAALAAIAERVPDLILVTTLLSPRDESELTDRLRHLEGADHLQTLTIPLLAASAAAQPKKKRRGLLSAFTGETETPAAPSGCDPAVFAEEIRNYVVRAEELKVHASADRERKRVSRKKKGASEPSSSIILPGAKPSTGGALGETPEVRGPQGSYWSWDPAESASGAGAASTFAVDASSVDKPVAPGAPVASTFAADAASADKPAAPAAPAAPVSPGQSSWANPWDISRAAEPSSGAFAEPERAISADPVLTHAEPGPLDQGGVDPAPSTNWGVQARAALEGLVAQPAPTYLDDHELPDLTALPVVTESAADALLERPARQTAADLLATQPENSDEAGPGMEIDLSALLDGGDRPAERETPQSDIYTLSPDAVDSNVWLDRPVPVTPAPAPAPSVEVRTGVSEVDRSAMAALRADVDRLHADRESVESALAEARAAQERAELAAAEAVQRAREESARHVEELAARARQDAATERKTREREEQHARDEAERRLAAERQAREEFERLTREVESRVREEAAAERRLREQAERAARQAEAARAQEARERQAREDAERQARAHAEEQAAAERRAREEAEARAEAERQARRAAEEKAAQEAARIAREAEARLAREAAELKAREEAERKARQEADARAAAERQARQEAERQARAEADRLAREAEDRRAREAAELKAREAAERKARERAEQAAREAEAQRAREHAELKAREATERKARLDAEARAEAERSARKEAERQARVEATRRAEMERTAREDAERLAAESATKAREEARAERKARELAERRAAEERKAREQAERRAREEATRRAAAEARAKHEAERRTREQPRSKKAVVVRKAKRKAEPEPVRTRKPKNDPARPTQDEWGLYDPEKAGFGALFARLEAIENGEPPEEEASAADLLADAGTSTRSPRPLSMWAWRTDHGPVPPMDPATIAATDDFRGLVDRLRLPAAVAAVRYASGARIRRVTVTRGVKHVRGGNGDRPVIILSRKMLKAIRAETSRAPAA